MILELIDMFVEQNLKLNWEEIINGARENSNYDPCGLIGSGSIYKVYGRRFDPPKGGSRGNKNRNQFKFG